MRRRRRRKFFGWILAGMLLASVLFYSRMERNLAPAAAALAEHQARRTATAAMIEGVEEILSRFPEEKLTEVFRDGDGEVQSVEVQISAVNRMKTEITERILRNLQEAGKGELLIPIGSLMRSGILSGRGPTLRYRFLPEGSVSARISTRFEACGVNQTRHQLLLSLEVQCCAILGRQQVEVTELGEYVLAETVLVGRVPESYTQVITEEREVIRDLNDYRTEK